MQIFLLFHWPRANGRYSLIDKTIIELGYRKLLQINYFDLLCSPLTNNDILGDRLFKPQPDQQSGS